MRVKPKKKLGQHFLLDNSIAHEIVSTLPYESNIDVLEVGSGMGVLTKIMLQISTINLTCVEIDGESIAYLHQNFPKINLIETDFLKLDLDTLPFKKPFFLIGNFPYNISNQIFFKVLENKDNIVQCSGLIQKEVAERITSPHGKKTYGILSVLLQTFFDIEYIKTIPPDVFFPKPKVESAIIRLRRNGRKSLNCDEKLFKTVIKTAFNQRRKQLRNSLKGMVNYKDTTFKDAIFSLRPEQLNIEDFIRLTAYFEKDV